MMDRDGEVPQRILAPRRSAPYYERWGFFPFPVFLREGKKGGVLVCSCFVLDCRFADRSSAIRSRNPEFLSRSLACHQNLIFGALRQWLCVA